MRRISYGRIGAAILFSTAAHADLLAHYRLEETTGDVVDSAGSNNGTNFGATRGIPGKDGDAFSFDGDDYVGTPLGSSLTYPDGISIQLWVKSTDSDDAGLVISRGAGGGASAELAGINSGLGQGRPCMNLWGLSDSTVCANTSINDNSWHHIDGKLSLIHI